MDISGQYIEMCEKAKEIQRLRQDGEWEGGDFLSYFYVGEWSTSKERDIGIIWNGLLPDSGYHDWDSNWSPPSKGNEAIWLPRQDQLQDMLNLFPLTAFGGGLIKYDEMVMGCYDQFQDSWEQLWLAFVMKEKYHKVWNGEDWAGE